MICLEHRGYFLLCWCFCYHKKTCRRRFLCFGYDRHIRRQASG